MPLVLITGATGFVGTCTVEAALKAGYKVRGTVRKLDSAKTAELKKLFPDIELVACDLMKDEGWEEAVKGVDFVLHVASPYMPAAPETMLVACAVEGTKRVLEAAEKLTCIKRICVVSSVAAIRYGIPHKANYTGEDWSDSENTRGYVKSKVLAEKWAYDFHKEKKPSWELCTINPAGIFGPMYGKLHLGAESTSIMEKVLTGEYYRAPRMMFGFVDVRDCADALIGTMDPKKDVNGKRYILSSNTQWIGDFFGGALKEFMTWGYDRIPQKNLPTPIVWLGSWFVPMLAIMYPDIGFEYNLDGTPAHELLPAGKYRDIGKAVADHAHALLKFKPELQTREYKQKYLNLPMEDDEKEPARGSCAIQ